MDFFTSDTHWYHRNIIKYSNRPFADVDEMNEVMIMRWNEAIPKDGTVYHLGDFSFGTRQQTESLIERLNGKIHLILGNHDQVIRKHPGLQSMFESVSEFKEVYIHDMDAVKNRRKIVLCHYAMRVWNKSHHGAYHLYGHSHGSLPDDINSRSFDVGVDCHNFSPITYRQVKRIMEKKNFVPIDHHGND